MVVGIGKRITSIRKELGLTIKDISLMSGVASSLISQIENDKANPSLSTLMSLAKALNTNIASFFDKEEAAHYTPVVRSNERVLISHSKGVANYLLTNSEMDFQYTVFEPNASTEDSPEINLYKSPMHEFGYVITGKLKVELNGRLYVLNPEDSIYFEANEPHVITNLLSSACSEAIWLMIPV